jgi:hypothetical protein
VQRPEKYLSNYLHTVAVLAGSSDGVLVWVFIIGLTNGRQTQNIGLVRRRPSRPLDVGLLDLGSNCRVSLPVNWPDRK